MWYKGISLSYGGGRLRVSELYNNRVMEVVLQTQHKIKQFVCLKKIITSSLGCKSDWTTYFPGFEPEINVAKPRRC
jgi:hypothetical protein